MSNVTQTIVLRGDSVGTVFVGYAGEKEARGIEFDFAKWQETYGAGALQLLFQRPTEPDPYPVALTTNGTTATWLPNATDTAICGQAKSQLIYTVDGVIAKTAIFTAVISQSLGTESDPPNSYETWLEALIRLGSKTIENAQAAEQSAGNAVISEANAGSSAAQAAVSAGNANRDAERAEQAATAAGNAKAAAETAQGKAEDAQDAAETAASSVSASAAQIATNAADIRDLKNVSSKVVFQDPILLVDTTELTFTKDGGNAWYVADVTSMNLGNLPEDAIYTVTWDGVEYQCGYYFIYERKNAESTSAVFYHTLGNVSPLGYAPVDSGNAPFLVKATDDRSLGIADKLLAFNSTAGTHTIKIVETPYIKTLAPAQLVVPTIRNVLPIRKGTGNQSLCLAIAKNASGLCSFAEGVGGLASGVGAHAEGCITVASQAYAHAEGMLTTASSYGSHSEGCFTAASGWYSHAEGNRTTASGKNTHAEGSSCEARGDNSHAQGRGAIASHFAQTALGMYNVIDPSSAAVGARGNYVEIVGNGADADNRSNARTLDWSGNESLAGGITLGKGTADETTLTATQLKALLALLS